VRGLVAVVVDEGEDETVGAGLCDGKNCQTAARWPGVVSRGAAGGGGLLLHVMSWNVHVHVSQADAMVTA